MVDTTLERFGRVDVLVNNAGVGQRTAVEDETVEMFRNAMELNVTAVWHLSKLVAPSMIGSGGGSIVNIASMLGSRGVGAGEAGRLLRFQGSRRQPHPRARRAALLLLAGPGRTFMTGQSVIVDGGWTAR